MMDRSLYPKNWAEIALEIKAAAGWICQSCDSQGRLCQRPCRKPGESFEDFEDRVIEGSAWSVDYWENVDDDELGSVLIRRGKRFELGVAHLDHVPSNCHLSNLKALCTPCHCRYDLSQMSRKKMLKRERLGQLSLFGQ